MLARARVLCSTAAAVAAAGFFFKLLCYIGGVDIAPRREGVCPPR